MLQFMGSQRVGHDLVTEQQQQQIVISTACLCIQLILKNFLSYISNKVGKTLYVCVHVLVAQ